MSKKMRWLAAEGWLDDKQTPLVVDIYLACQCSQQIKQNKQGESSKATRASNHSTLLGEHNAGKMVTITWVVSVLPLVYQHPSGEI